MVDAAERFFDQDPRQDACYDRARSGLSSHLRRAPLGAFLDEAVRRVRVEIGADFCGVLELTEKRLAGPARRGGLVCEQRRDRYYPPRSPATTHDT